VKLGLLTAAFPQLGLEEIARWASAAGFETLEIACRPAGAGGERRYAGVSHVDVETLDDEGGRAIVDMLAGHGLTISALAYYPNNLDPDPEHREQANEHLRKVIAAAPKLGVEIVGTFVGRVKERSEPEELALVWEVWPPLVEYAAEQRVKIAIENCPMIFSYDECREARTSPTHRRFGGSSSRSCRRRTSGSTSSRRISSGS
jgi:sugar phosphate isomerase/epimerase